jgi:hypothetical protein
MKPSVQDIIKRQGKAKAKKTSWDTKYQEVAEYCIPDTEVTGLETKDFQDRRENIYTSLGEQCANDFVNTMQEVLAPPMGNWIQLEAGMKVAEADKDDINAELAEACKYANEYKNNSSFDIAFSEFCYDVFLGTGCMLVLPNNPTDPISFKSIPIREYCLEEGIKGEVRAVYREYNMTREFIGATWKECKKQRYDKEDKDKEITIIECVFYDYDLNVYHYLVIDKANEVELLCREYATNPFIVLRWNKKAGEPYGRGVGMVAINDIKTLNLIKFYSLRNFAYQLPILLAQESDIIDYDNFDPTPLTINIVPDTQNSIVPLEINPKYEAEGYKTTELAMDIKKNTYSGTLPNEGNRELTATEVRARLQELRKTLSSVFGRLITEFQIPITRRIFDVLSDTGMFGKEFKEKFTTDKIDGLVWKVNVVTPIGKIARYEEAQTLLTTAMNLAQFDQTGGLVRMAFKFNEYMYEYLKLTGIPLELINTPEEMRDIQEQEAQGQMQAQQSMIQADAEAKMAIDTNKSLNKL